MPRPRCILLAGPNGAGKSSLYETFVAPRFPELEFINADRIASESWPGAESERAYEAARMAAHQRDEAIRERRSFVSETVFSHPSKVELVERARSAGFEVWLLIVYVDVELAVARIRYRVTQGGHPVPEHKIRERHGRLFPLLAQAMTKADRIVLSDNCGEGHRAVARYAAGEFVWNGDERPDWAVGLLERAGLL